MSRLPTLDAPTGSEGALPTSSLVVPSVAAEGGAVGAGVEEAGAQITRLGVEEYHRVQQVKAMEAESRYLAFTMAQRESYSELTGHDALKAYPSTVQALEDERQKITQGLGSRQAALLFNANAMRNQRIVEGVVESHYAQQRKVVQIGAYKTNVALVTREVAGLAAQPITSDMQRATTLNAIQEHLSGLRDKAEAMGHALGYDDQEAKDFAEKELAAPAEAALSALSKPSTDLPTLRHALDLWSKYASPAKQGDYANAYSMREGRQMGLEAAKNLPLVDLTGQEDAHGSPDPTKYGDLLNSLDPSDPKQREAMKALSQEYNRLKSAATDYSRNLQKQVLGSGMRGAHFQLDLTNDKFRELQRLDAGRADSLVLRSNADARAQEIKDARAQVKTDKAALDKFTATLNDLRTKDPYEFIKLDPEAISGEIKDLNAGGTVLVHKSEDLMRRMQKAVVHETMGPLLRTLNGDVDKELAATFKRMPQEQERWRGKLRVVLTHAIMNGDVKDVGKVSEFIRHELAYGAPDPEGGFFQNRTRNVERDYGDLTHE